MYCSLTAGLTAVNNMYWPTGGGAQCVNLTGRGTSPACVKNTLCFLNACLTTEVESLYPGVTIPPVCNQFIIWEKVYVDNNTLVRNVLGRYVLFDPIF